MNFEELIEMVIDYAVEYKCTIETSINDLEFDGPDGGSGGSMEDIVRLLNHFGDRVEMLVSLDPNGGTCYHYTDEKLVADDNSLAELLSL